ncbi:MAG TPA: mechanosensitive ion channel family protein [Bryobacteraceae bacterium]|nr:mechanosensitive ion channel family protein [Bryobacteraceae bacterium]
MKLTRGLLPFHVFLLACFGFLNAEIASGQALSNLLGKATPSSAPSPQPDPLNRTTPRSSMTSFLEACHSGKLETASKYLDLRKGSDEESHGPELAQTLADLLDHDSEFDLADLNNTPEGSRDDGLAADMERLATFRLDGQTVPLNLQRISRNGTRIWVVSSASVGHIPELAVLTRESGIEKLLPAPLITIKLLGTSLYAWIGLLLLALVLSFLSKLLSRGVIALAKPVTKRYTTEFNTARLSAFTEPLRLLLSIAVFRACMEAFTTSALLRLYLRYVLECLFALGVASLAMRIVDLIADHLHTRVDARQRAVSFSVLPLGVRIAKITIFCLAVLFTLAAWGYNTNAILAGVGVGGLAVALAAQKTIENLFGSVAVISDRPVLVGDFCQFGGQVGTVEDIGLRSTRIRTLERTLVTIPNSTFSTMTLENYSRRDRMWFHPTIHLRRGTTPDEIRAAMDAITKVLKEHPSVDPTAVPVRFTKMTTESFDLEIFSYVLTPDFNEFLKVQSQLLLTILESLSALRVVLAVPIEEMVVTGEQEGELRPYRQILPSQSAVQNSVGR